MARKKKNDLQVTVEKAKQYLDQVQEQRDKISREIQAKQAEVGGKRHHIGQSVVEGGDLPSLASDLAHGERELEAMRQALVEADQLLADAEAGFKVARASELKDEIAECYQAGIDKYKSASSAFDEIEKIVKDILSISKQGRDAFAELIPLVPTPEKQTMEWKVQGLKKPAAILMAAINHYRSYFKIDRA